VNFTVTRPLRFDLKLHLPELLLASARSRLGTGIKYDVSTTGGEGTVTVDCSPVSGSTFPFGSSTIKCIATDQSGQRDGGEISVMVADTTPPALSLPKSFEVAAESQEGEYVKYDVAATDDIDGAISPSCLPKSGDFFRPGRTIVTCEADDSSFNPMIGSFEVFVRPRDYGKLQLEVPADMKVDAQSKEGAIVFFDVRAFGSADPDPLVQCTPESGSDFRMGDTKVYCTATDDFDQRAEGGFIVSVVDPNGLKTTDMNIEATSPAGAEVSWEIPKPKNWTAEIQCSPSAGTTFALGETKVTCSSTGERGKKL
jgi:hypothetical protein